MTAPAGDSASAQVFVKLAPEQAFAVFTDEIDLWWRTGPRFRIAGRERGRLTFEPGPSGRLFETFETRGGARTFVVGAVRAWEPPTRIELEWRNVNFRPDEQTFVEVTFRPQRDGTLVTVRHWGFAALPGDHPARHGLLGADFCRMMGLWWGDLLSALRVHVSTPGSADPGAAPTPRS